LSFPTTRLFHNSPSIWKNTDPEADEHSSASPSITTPKVSQDELAEIVEDAEITAAGSTEKLAAQSRSSDELDEEIIAKLAQGASLEDVLQEHGMDPADVSEELKAEVLAAVEDLRKVDAKHERIDNFAAELTETPDDVEGALARAGMHEGDLTSLSKRDRKLLREQGVDPQDDEAMDRAAYRAWGGDGQEAELESHDIVQQYTRDMLGEGGETEPKNDFIFDPMGRGGYLDKREEMHEEDPAKREPQGFWNEDKDEDLGPDEVFNQDDLPGSGHIDLDLQREIREYARLMVWELPLLSSMYSHPHAIGSS
jgi:hypothetical protein